MTPKTKYILSLHSIDLLSIVLWIVCIMPLLIASPFAALMNWYNEYLNRRRLRLALKYGISIPKETTSDD